MIKKSKITLFAMAISCCSLQYSCKESIKKSAGTKSFAGYYQTTKNTKEAPILISMELKNDSTALYVTDYNNFTPEIVLKGVWNINKEDTTVIDIKFNDELMRFDVKGDVLDLMTNHNFGKIGLTELRLVKEEKPVSEKSLIMWIAPELGSCDNTGAKKCLRVRWGDSDRGNYFIFQDSIVNFNYHAGVNYKIKVDRKLKAGLPADSTAYEYIFKQELLSRSPTAKL